MNSVNIKDSTFAVGLVVEGKTYVLVNGSTFIFDSVIFDFTGFDFLFGSIYGYSVLHEKQCVINLAHVSNIFYFEELDAFYFDVDCEKIKENGCYIF